MTQDEKDVEDYADYRFWVGLQTGAFFGFIVGMVMMIVLVSTTEKKTAKVVKNPSNLVVRTSPVEDVPQNLILVTTLVQQRPEPNSCQSLTKQGWKINLIQTGFLHQTCLFNGQVLAEKLDITGSK